MYALKLSAIGPYSSMQAFVPIFDLASRISKPLALSGFALAVLFFIFRQLLAKDIFPKLSVVVGGALLKQIVDRLFFLALVAMILGFIGYLVPLVRPTPPPKTLPSSASAESFLKLLYGHNYETAYDSLSPDLKSSIPFVAFKEQTRGEMSQFSAPPAYRHFKGIQTAAGYCAVTFDAEFDERSWFREVVTYADSANGWMLSRYEIYPRDWPLSTLAKQLNQTTAGAMFEKLKTLGASERDLFVAEEIVGRWIPLPGWTGRFERILAKKGMRTCDIQLNESTSGASLIARDVLDGCVLKPHRQVTLFGRIDGAGVQSAELSAIRYFSKM